MSHIYPGFFKFPSQKRNFPESGSADLKRSTRSKRPTQSAVLGANLWEYGIYTVCNPCHRVIASESCAWQSRTIIKPSKRWKIANSKCEFLFIYQLFIYRFIKLYHKCYSQFWYPYFSISYVCHIESSLRFSVYLYIGQFFLCIGFITILSFWWKIEIMNHILCQYRFWEII